MINTFCNHCGNKIPNNAKFCGVCGNNIEVEKNNEKPLKDNIILSNKEEVSITPNADALDNSIDWLVVRILLSIIVGGLIIGSALWWYLNGNGGSDTTSDQTVQNTSTNISRTFYVQADNTRVHDCASLSCKVIGYYSANSNVTLPYNSTADFPEWVQFTFQDDNGNNVTGYLKSTTLGENQISTTTIQVAHTAPLADNQNSSQSNIQGKLDLPTIIKEWRKSTAYVICYWDYPSGGVEYSQSGSGLAVILNSVPTIITNHHVVYSPTYGGANECDVRFPDDNGFYGYSNNRPIIGGQGYEPNTGNITYLNNLDVAFITGLNSAWFSTDYSKSNALPLVSLEERSKSGSYSCKNQLNIGDPVVVLGYPVYGTQTTSPGLTPVEITATEGIVSGVDNGYYTTSAKIDHGNSGGLAINETNDCYFGIPSWNESGSFESLGRILPTSLFLFYR